MSDVEIPEGVPLDQLRELANIGASWAAGALGQIVDRTVLTQVPVLHVSGTGFVTGDFASGVFVESLAEPRWRMGLFLPDESRDAIVGRMLAAAGMRPTIESFASAFAELGNIIASTSISAIANTVGGRTLTSLPMVSLAGAGASFASFASRNQRDGIPLCLESELFDRGGELLAVLVQVPIL